MLPFPSLSFLDPGVCVRRPCALCVLMFLLGCGDLTLPHWVLCFLYSGFNVSFVLFLSRSLRFCFNFSFVLFLFYFSLYFVSTSFSFSSSNRKRECNCGLPASSLDYICSLTCSFLSFFFFSSHFFLASYVSVFFLFVHVFYSISLIFPLFKLLLLLL